MLGTLSGAMQCCRVQLLPQPVKVIMSLEQLPEHTFWQVQREPGSCTSWGLRW